MKKLVMKDFLNYKFLSQLQWAPGGAHAALVSANARWEQNDYWSDIWVLTPQETLHRLTTKGDAKSFIWLNDHEILFPAIRCPQQKEKIEKGERITTFQKICIRGGEASEHFSVPYTVTGYKKICDNRFALVVRWHPADPDFAALDAAGKQAAYKHLKEEKDYEVLDEIPFWANGGGFTNKRRSRLYIYDIAKEEGHFITDELTNVSGFEVCGERIAYTANHFENKQEIMSGAYVHDLASGKTETLMPALVGELKASYVDFITDGYIIKASDGKLHGNGQYGDFYTHKNGKLELLAKMDEAAGNHTNSDARYGSGTQLMVYEDAIYYTAVDHVENVLRKITLDGKVETLVKQLDTVDAFDICESGILFYGLGAVTLHELFKLENGKPRQIGNFNGDFLSTVQLEKPIRTDAQGEAATVEGYVIPPVGYQPGKKYPAILNIHGGPKTAFGDSYFHENHLYSALGYFVLICNPWGSDGRGDEFADLRGRYGTIDYNDLMTFTDTCIDKFPDIDDKKVCVTGGSYGGYMTNWIIGHTDRFCCAASQRSIANWVSKFGTTDIGYFFNADQQQSTPWDNHDKIWWHSPMKYADKCVTPTLFIHSEEDYRCWVVEGIQMFTALKFHGCEARMCMFRGENHELSRSGKPKHRARRMQEMTNWFAQYAGGEKVCDCCDCEC